MELENSHDEERGKIDELYSFLKEQGTKDYLEYMEKRTICHTPLHEAAAAGMSHWALEVANLKPSLARKLNHEGLSLMHLALRHGHDQMVRALVAFDSGLIQVKGRDLVTPLHYAAELGETELLAEFLSACPSSIEDLTSRCETAMHLAVRNKRLDACKVLLGWMIRKHLAGILRWKDEDGNTVLHIATLTNQPEVMKLLIRYVKVNAKNFRGLTALDLCYDGEAPLRNPEIRTILQDVKAKRASEVLDSLTGAGYLGRARLFPMELWHQRLGLTDAGSRMKYSAELRTMTLGVAVLIATATYQGLLSPPGGYWQDGSTAAAAVCLSSYAPSPAVAAAAGGGSPHTAGKMIMSGEDRTLFLVFNSLAFFASTLVMVLTLFGMESALMLSVPINFAMVTYFLAVKQAATNKEANAIAAIADVLLVVVLVAYFVILWFWQILNRRKVRLDVPGRRIGGFI